MKQVGYTIGTIFIRSYEQGERVYTSMLCRGYGRDSHIFLYKKTLEKNGMDLNFLLCMIFIHRNTRYCLAGTVSSCITLLFCNPATICSLWNILSVMGLSPVSP